MTKTTAESETKPAPPERSPVRRKPAERTADQAGRPTTAVTGDSPRARAMNTLQRSAGNARAGKMMVQAKLGVDSPGDAHEQEADRVAGHVMRMAGPPPVSSFSSQHTAGNAKAGTTMPGGPPQLLQRKDDKPKPSGQVNTKDVFKEIQKRNPDLAELIDADTILGKKPKILKPGPPTDDVQHLWEIKVNPFPGVFSETDHDPDTKKAAGKLTQVTHHIRISWGTTYNVDPELRKQAASDQEAKILTLAEPLFHELLHARIIMERDPSWTAPHTSEFQDFQAFMKLAQSSAVSKERTDVFAEVAVLAGLSVNQPDKDAVRNIADGNVEFLIHEKFDFVTESRAFGKIAANARIADAYAKIVARRIGDVTVSDKMLQQRTERIARAAEKLFDKLDQGPATPAPAKP